MSGTNKSLSRLTTEYLGFIQYTNVKVFVLFVLFTLMSVYAVMTASGSEMYEYIFKGRGLSPIAKHLGILLVCYATIFAMSLIPLKVSRYVRSIATPLYILGCVGLLFLLFFNGVTINGSTRWVYVFGLISVQPSEFCKLGFILCLSLMSCLFFEQSRQDRSTYWRYYGWPLVILMGAVAYIGYSNMSTALIFAVCTLILLFVYKMPFRWLISTLGVIVTFIGLVFAVAFMLPEDMSVGRLGTFKARIERSLEEKNDKIVLTDENRQEYYANIAIANSKFIGRGIGNSEMKDILPMAMSDYVLAVIIEEIGIWGMALVSLLYISWFWLILVIAHREEDRFFRYVLYGIGVFYPFQALINFVVVSGIITTGQPLPFISAGGSSILSNTISLGVVLMISRWQTERKLLREAEEAKALSNEQAQ